MKATATEQLPKLHMDGGVNKNTTKKNLSATIIETLKERILRWDYLPGHRLTEQHLCREFNVSRSPVREALRCLTEKGLIQKEAFRGYRVLQPKLNEIDWLYELRLALELYVVEYLAQKGVDRETLKNLQSPWQNLSDTEKLDNETLAESDRAFHESLARLTGNAILMKSLRDVNDRLIGLRMIDFSEASRVEGTCREHLEIIDAITRGDIDAARNAIKSNIGRSRKLVKTAVQAALLKGIENTPAS